MNYKTKHHIIRIVSSRFLNILPRTQKIRFFVYKKMFHLTHWCSIHNNVIISAHHRTPDSFDRVNEYGITIGRDAIFNDDVTLDTTGCLIIGDRVSFAEGATVFTHEHKREDDGKKTISFSSLSIGDDVLIGARAMILSSCTIIGRAARIGAGSVVRSAVPPYAIVIGNPAKVIGFKYPPKQIIEHEKMLYEEKDRLPIDVLENNYKKYFTNRIKEIKSILKN